MKKKDVNPEWDEDLTLSLSDPDQPILLVSFCGLYIISDNTKAYPMSDALYLYLFFLSFLYTLGYGIGNDAASTQDIHLMSLELNH